MFVNKMKYIRAKDAVTKDAAVNGTEVTDEAIKAKYIVLGGLIKEDGTDKVAPVAGAVFKGKKK